MAIVIYPSLIMMGVSKKDASNYRPIGMQRILARLMEWYICMLFIKLLERRKIFGDYIHGFFAKHSCESGISYFTGLARDSVAKNKMINECTSSRLLGSIRPP